MGFVQKKFFFAIPIRFLMEFFLPMTISALIGVFSSDYSTLDNGMSSGFSALLLFVFVSFPLLISIFLFRKQKFLENDYYKSKFGAAYAGIQT